MEKTFRHRKSLKTTYICCLVFFVLFGLASACGMWIDARPAFRVQAAVFMLVFWGAWAALCGWALFAYKKERLTITNEQIAFQGVIRRKEIDLASIKEAIWRIGNHGSLVLKSLTEKLTIRFDNYEPEDRLWIIRHLQSHIPLFVQHHWDMFCLKVAVPMRDGMQRAGIPPGPDEISITRGRWDRYFLPVIGIATIFGIAAWWKFQEPRLLISPFGFVALWLMLRFLTPKKGFINKRISAEPGLSSFLCFAGIWYVVVMAGIALFRFLPLQPPASYVAATMAFVFWVSVFLIRIHKEDQRRTLKDNEAAPVALQKWEQNQSPSAPADD